VEDDIVYSKDVLEFVTVAAEYCSFVEAVNQYSKKDFLNKFIKISNRSKSKTICRIYLSYFIF